jgi:hypothetical protein
VIVVHANESRLSINEANSGIGYKIIYQAMLKATRKLIGVNVRKGGRVEMNLLEFIILRRKSCVSRFCRR